MRLATPLRIGLLMLVSTGAAAAMERPEPVTLTRVSSEENPREDGQASAAYVVAGCGLMSLGLLFGNIRQKPVRRRSRL